MTGFFVPHDVIAPVAGATSGPLAGFNFAVKDLYDVSGTRTGGGSPEWHAAQTPAAEHADAVRRLLDAGANLIGKTICDEFFFSVSGANAHYGTPSNLRAPNRMPGGSSSGSAAATASGACDFALGSDTGGSVRIPASFCGLYGIRPTHGRINLAGGMAMAPTYDTAGWFANGPGLFRRVGGVLLDEGTRVNAPIQRMILAEDAFEQADPEVTTLIKTGLKRATSQSVRIAPDGFDGWREAFRVIQGFETWKTYGAFITAVQPKLGPGIKERMAYAASVTEADAAAARKIHDQARAHLRALISPGTIVMMPTAPCIAPRLDTPADALDAFRVRVMRLTCVAGLSGLPQVSIPVGTVSGCPIGLSLVGWAGGDETLLDLAVAGSKMCGLEG